ncbi:MAG: phosphate ABC transporter permease PstA [Acidimicrobiaceae bacterium]|jgi:phosphate transport system permease protein|nr:phosphate ABC transporter permease PstA [Ilumatobacteraceae bacterium]
MTSLPSLRAEKTPSRSAKDLVFRIFMFAGIGIALGSLATLLANVIIEGAPRLNLDLVTSMPSARPRRAGIQSAIFGSLWVVLTTAAISLPTGIGAAIYLEEFARRDRWYNRLIELNVQNLAAVPSVVFGILGLAFIKRGPLGLGSTVITASLVLSMLVLPTVVIVSREAIRAVPDSFRQGSLALGATKWETVRHQVLPNAFPGILTGTILSVSRALGESAPLLMLGALTFITFNPTGLDSQYTVLPIQIFSYISSAKQEFRPLAAASIVVLLAVLLALNAVAIFLRNKYQKRW